MFCKRQKHKETGRWGEKEKILGTSEPGGRFPACLFASHTQTLNQWSQKCQWAQPKKARQRKLIKVCPLQPKEQERRIGNLEKHCTAQAKHHRKNSINKVLAPSMPEYKAKFLPSLAVMRPKLPDVFWSGVMNSQVEPSSLGLTEAQWRESGHPLPNKDENIFPVGSGQTTWAPRAPSVAQYSWKYPPWVSMETKGKPGFYVYLTLIRWGSALSAEAMS